MPTYCFNNVSSLKPSHDLIKAECKEFEFRLSKTLVSARDTLKNGLENDNLWQGNLFLLHFDWCT